MFLRNKRTQIFLITCIMFLVLIQVSYTQLYDFDLQPPIDPSETSISSTSPVTTNNNQYYSIEWSEEVIKNESSFDYSSIIRPILKYNKDNKFKIVQFTDLHYGEEVEYDISNKKNQEIILEIEKPDFVMLSGDMISGYRFTTVEEYTNAWKQLTEPMIKRNIPWSITFGNHDCEGLLTCKEIALMDMKNNLSLTQINPIIGLPGITNYQLNIYPNDYEGKDIIGDSSFAKSLIYIFDSDTNGCRDSEFWGCIQKPQVDWYRNVSEKNQRKEAIAFVHIPPTEVIDLWNNVEVVGDFGDSSVCCYYTDESKFVETMIQQGDVKGLYFGHDHKNDFHGNYYGIDLGYGRKSGYGSYNPKYLEGARILELTAEPYSIDTWIRDNTGFKDVQKSHKPNQYSQYPIYCCQPGDPKDEPWLPFLLAFASISLVLTFLVLFKKYKNSDKNQSIQFKPIENQ